MTHDRVIFSGKQEKSKKNLNSRVFDRKNKDISGFYSYMPQACFELTTNPNGYYARLPWRHARVLRTLVHFGFNFSKVDISYERIAELSDCCDRTVKNALNRFRRDGLVSTFYRHMKTNLFKISIDFCRRNVLDALQEHIPVLRKVFYIGLLTSFSILKPTDSLLSCLQEKRLIFIRSYSRNDRRMSSVLTSKNQDFSKTVKMESNAMPGVYPYEMLDEETKAFLRDSSHNEQLARDSGLVRELPKRGPVGPEPRLEDYLPKLPNVNDYPMEERASVRKTIRDLKLKAEVLFRRARKLWRRS